MIVLCIDLLVIVIVAALLGALPLPKEIKRAINAMLFGLALAIVALYCL